MNAERKPLRTYKGLQALRGIAAIAVVILHSTFYAHERLDNRFPLWAPGATGVDIFFVLSGFVMVYSSSRLFGHPGGWKVFAERRIARIVPLYWLATTFKLVAVLFASKYVLHASFSLWKVICSYFFIPVRNVDGVIEPLLGVGWTLNFEMAFYLIFSFALFLKSNIYRFCGTIFLLLTIGSHFKKQNWPAASFYLQTIVLEFFFGMLLARICLARRHLPYLVAIGFFATGILLLLIPWPEMNLPRGLVLGIPAALTVWATASLENLFSRLPRWPLYLGDASYAIYLFHPMCAPLAPTLLARAHLIDPRVSVMGSVFIAMTIGCVIHQFLEIPLNEAIRKKLHVRNQIA